MMDAPAPRLSAATRPPTPSKPTPPMGVCRFHNPLGWFAVLSTVLGTLHLVAWRFEILTWLVLAEALAAMIAAMIGRTLADRRALRSFDFQNHKWN